MNELMTESAVEEHDLLDTKSNTDEIASMVQDKYIEAKDARYDAEQTWVLSQKNMRGQYDSDTAFLDGEEPTIFVKVTKTKVMAAYGIAHEILFPESGTKFPINIEPTPVPDDVADAVHIDQKAPKDEEEPLTSPYGFPGDGNDLQPGDTQSTIMQRLGGLAKKLNPFGSSVKEGEGNTPTAITYHPAKEAAYKFNKKVQDQFLEGGAHDALKMAVYETVLFGTGVIKGPFAVTQEFPRWEKEEGKPAKYSPKIKDVPTWSHISIWDCYPDPNARNKKDLEYFIVRHRLTRKGMYDLKKRQGFDAKAINDAIKGGPNYNAEWWEWDLDDDDSEDSSGARWQALEYWGFVDREQAEDFGIEIPKEYSDLDMVQMSIWECNGHVLRAILNPFQPAQIPFHVMHYENNPYSFWGVGLAENMSDTQLLMNGFMRLAITNSILSGSVMLDVDEDALSDGQTLEVKAGKIFRRNGGQAGTAISSIKVDNVSQQNMQMFDKARQLADESTGFPSFAHGQTGVSGVGRTASGISMLMGAASTNIKTFIKNIDTMIEGMGKAQYAWNMQFDYDPDLHFDLEIRAGGTDAFVSKEIRSQRLLQFLGIVSNPITAPWAKLPYIIKEIAVSLDLDADKITNDPREAMLQAMVMQQQAAKQGGGGEGTPGISPNDPTGGGAGNIGVGAPAMPGQQGFSGTPQQQGAMPPQQGSPMPGMPQ